MKNRQISVKKSWLNDHWDPTPKTLTQPSNKYFIINGDLELYF